MEIWVRGGEKDEGDGVGIRDGIWRVVVCDGM